MLSKLRPRLTYANVVVTVALVAALGGGAYAATNLVAADGTIKGCAKKKGGALRVVKPDKKCPRKTTAVVWSQTGPRGENGAQGSEGSTGPQGEPGAEGEPGTARAYAYVEVPNCTGTPTICPAFRSKGISEVRRTYTGGYCVKAPGINSAVTTASVTVAAGGGTTEPTGNATAAYLPTSTPTNAALCTANTDFVVETELQSPTAVRNAAGDGTQLVAGNAIPSNSVSFLIVIP